MSASKLPDAASNEPEKLPVYASGCGPSVSDAYADGPEPPLSFDCSAAACFQVPLTPPWTVDPVIVNVMRPVVVVASVLMMVPLNWPFALAGDGGAADAGPPPGASPCRVAEKTPASNCVPLCVTDHWPEMVAPL